MPSNKAPDRVNSPHYRRCFLISSRPGTRAVDLSFVYRLSHAGAFAANLTPSQVQYPTCQAAVNGICIDLPGSPHPSAPATAATATKTAARTPVRAKPLTQTGITSTSSGVLYYVDNYQRIHQLFWGGSQWLDADLMSSSGSGYNVAPGSGVAVDANGILYYADTSGDVHQMYWGGTKFMDADLMASSGSGVKAQAGTGSSVDANGNVYYVSTGQTVHQMWWGGTQMMDADLMASSGSGVQVDSATEIALDSDATIYYVSTDGAVHKMYWGGSNFLDTRLMSVSSQPNSRAESGTGVAIDSNLNVYYVDTAQTVHQMLWNGSEFADSNLMSSSGSGMLVSLGTQPWVDSSGNVYYVDTSQNIHKMYWGGSQWLDTNLMSSSGIGYLAQGDSEGAVDGSGNVYYISMNQNIYQMFWNGTQYQDINLMASSGSGVLAAGSFTISGQVTDGSTGLPGVSVSLGGTRSFSTATNSGGGYSFAVPAEGSYTVTPSLFDYNFSPSSQVLNGLDGNLTLNFTASISGGGSGAPDLNEIGTPSEFYAVPNPSGSGTGCTSIAGYWDENSSPRAYWSLTQSGTSVSGTVSASFGASCGTITWSVAGQASTQSIGAFAVTASNPSTAKDACGNTALTPINETVTVSGSGCTQGSADVTSPGGSFNTTWTDPTPPTSQVPTKISVASSPPFSQSPTTFSGAPGLRCDGNAIGNGLNVWGYERCITWTLLDQTTPGKPISNVSHLLATESISYVKGIEFSNFEGNNSVSLAADATWGDMWLRVRDDGPIPAGTFAMYKQVISIQNSATGQTFNARRINCIRYGDADVTVTDVTTTGDQTCMSY